MAQTDLGKWMITNGGNYNSETTYEQLTIVLYNNSMFLTLKTVKGITPVNDNINYSLMAQAAATTLLSGINATDTYGALGEVGATVSSQALVDYLADSVMNKLIAKTQIVNNLTTQDSDKVLSALQGYNLKQSVDELKDNFNSHVATISLPAAVETTANNIIKNCKACCASMQEAYKIHLFCGHNSGYATIIGYTYETSETTRYASFLFQSIASNNLYACRCYEGNWVVYEIKGTKLE